MIFQNEKTHFQAIKTRSSNSRKILVFPKCLAHAFSPKLVIFRPFFLQVVQTRKICLLIFQNEKTPFKAIKGRSSKSPKIGILPMGLVHAFGPKLVIFPRLFVQAIQARKICFMIFQNEKTLIQVIKTRSSESLKIDIFPMGLVHAFGPKLVIFPLLFVQAIQARKMCFMIFQNENTLIQVIKTRSSESRKIDIFPKGLVHAFGPKLAIFPPFLFRQYRPGKCVL